MNIQTGHLRHQKNFSSHFLGGKERFLCFVDAEVNNQSNEVSEIQKKTEELLDGLREKMQGKESLNVEEIHTVLTAKLYSQFSREHIKKEIEDAQKRLYATDKSDKNNDDNLQATEFGEFAKEIFFENQQREKNNISLHQKVQAAIKKKEKNPNADISKNIEGIKGSEFQKLTGEETRTLFLEENGTVNFYGSKEAFTALGMYDFYSDYSLNSDFYFKKANGEIGRFGINKNPFPAYLLGKYGFITADGSYIGVGNGDKLLPPPSQESLLKRTYKTQQKVFKKENPDEKLPKFNNIKVEDVQKGQSEWEKEYKRKEKEEPEKIKTATGEKEALTDKSIDSKLRRSAIETVNRINKNPQIAKSVEKYSKEYKVDKYLIYAIIRQESRGKVMAKSPKNAKGLMQLMPDTFEEKKVGNNPYDIDQNIHAGTKHLNFLLKRFNGNIKLSVAAYNAGHGTIEKNRGIPHYLETQTYAREVPPVYKYYKNHAKELGI